MIISWARYFWPPSAHEEHISKTHFSYFYIQKHFSFATAIGETSHHRNIPSPNRCHRNGIAETASPKRHGRNALDPKYFTLPKNFLPLHQAVSKPISASLSLEVSRTRLGLEGYRSRSQTYCLETLNTATIWLSKTSLIQPLRSWNTFCLLYVHVRNNIKQASWKNSGNLQNVNSDVGDDTFLKIFRNISAKSANFRVSEFLMKSWSRSLSLDYVSADQSVIPEAYRVLENRRRN